MWRWRRGARLVGRKWHIRTRIYRLPARLNVIFFLYRLNYGTAGVLHTYTTSHAQSLGRLSPRGHMNTIKTKEKKNKYSVREQWAYVRAQDVVDNVARYRSMGGPSTAMTTTTTTTKRHQIERRYICLLFYNRLVIMCVVLKPRHACNRAQPLTRSLCF